jgi:RNA-dependent RNA polymerase
LEFCDSELISLLAYQILYGAASLDESKKQRQRIHDEACAIYQVVYEYAKLKKDTYKCYFAWRVAGEALCEIYFHNHQKQPILISPALLYDILS